MNAQAIITVWPALALIGYVLITCVFYTLASHYHVHRALHDRVRESLLLRARYKAALDAVRQEDAAAK